MTPCQIETSESTNGQHPTNVVRVDAPLERTQHGTGFTPLGEALEITATRLIARRENRRILLTITDGHAGCEGGGQAAQLHAQHTAQRITQAGIELIGIAIQDQSLCAVVADTIVVNDIAELPAQLCRLLSRTLKKGLRHVG